MAKKKVSTDEETVRNIRLKTRKKHSGEEKIRSHVWNIMNSPKGRN